MSDDVKKQHISTNERLKWNNHIGNKGVEHHQLGDGITAGFSLNNYDNTEKGTLKELHDNIGSTRITFSTEAPPNPSVDKELWIDRGSKLIKIYTDTGWESIGAVFL